MQGAISMWIIVILKCSFLHRIFALIVGSERGGLVVTFEAPTGNGIPSSQLSGFRSHVWPSWVLRGTGVWVTVLYDMGSLAKRGPWAIQFNKHLTNLLYPLSSQLHVPCNSFRLDLSVQYYRQLATEATWKSREALQCHHSIGRHYPFWRGFFQSRQWEEEKRLSFFFSKPLFWSAPHSFGNWFWLDWCRLIKTNDARWLIITDNDHLCVCVPVRMYACGRVHV